MARHPFGWDLPPGVTQRMIDEQYGPEEPCQCCGHDPADCICPECPDCGEQGNPKCYSDCMDPEDPKFHHGINHLTYNRDQRIGQSRMRISMLKEQIQDEEMFLAYMESNPEDTGDES